MLRHLNLKMEIKIKTIDLFLIDNERLLEKYITIWVKIEDLKNIELKALSFYDNRYVKTKIRTHGDKIYTTVRGI